MANQAAFHAWIQSHSPLEILNANIARNMLKRRGVPAMHKLPDDRQVIRARSNYTFFYRDRLDTGDFKHMVLSDAAKQISGEWNKLNEAEKEVRDSSFTNVTLNTTVDHDHAAIQQTAS